MRNLFIVFISLLMMLSLFACEVEESAPQSTGPEHHELTVPKGHRLMNIECGRPCIITFDAANMSYVVQYVDGGTLVVHFRAAR